MTIIWDDFSTYICSIITVSHLWRGALTSTTLFVSQLRGFSGGKYFLKWSKQQSIFRVVKPSSPDCILNTYYCGRSELLICKVHQFGLSGVSKTVQFDLIRMRRMFLFVVVVFGKHQYRIFSNLTSVPDIVQPWSHG